MEATNWSPHLFWGWCARRWLETTHGKPPVDRCTLVIPDNKQYRIQDDNDVEKADRDDLDPGPSLHRGIPTAPGAQGPYANAWSRLDYYANLFDLPLEDTPRERDNEGSWIPYFGVEKYDPVEHTFRPGAERKRAMDILERRHGPRFYDMPVSKDLSWYGIVSEKIIAIEVVNRNYEEPHMNEVTNAIYSALFKNDGLRYVILHDIQNPDTEELINDKLLPALEDVPDVNHWSFNAGTDEYYALLGTKLGQLVGFWMMGRYPRGTCTIPKIHIAVSGGDNDWDKTIDVCFEVRPTSPPHELPEAPESFNAQFLNSGDQAQHEN